MNIGSEIKLAGGVAVLLALLGMGLYIRHAAKEINHLNQQLGVEKVAKASAEANLTQLQKEIHKQTVQLDKLNKEAQAAEQEQQKIEDIFAKHDLGQLANKKPGLIQDHVNKATAKVIKEFNDVTKQ